MSATVRSYFDMLLLEVSGRAYVKSDFRRALIPLLNNRSESAVEYKFRNISAVIMQLGLRPLRGYKPALNYQKSLFSEVERRLASTPHIVELMVFEAGHAPAANQGNTLNATSAAIPKTIHMKSARRAKITTAFPDYAAIEAQNRALGLAGELAVLDLEYQRLCNAGKVYLARRIDHVSASRGDGDGFDISSFEVNGKEKLIEVKTTRSRAETPFFITSNELHVSVTRADSYYLYRVFNFGNDSAWFSLQGSLEQTCQLQPNSFTAVPYKS
ncbi:hypothetical protein CFN17_11765 [Arthrobacter sp. PM3]|nr:hypothetical protein CFN17_11765 [Arthrobacter sp. PM3]